MMRFLAAVLLTACLIGCQCDMTSEEKCALTMICTDQCTMMGSNSFGIDRFRNGFGQVFYYNCLCFPKMGGYGNPVKIQIDEPTMKNALTRVKVEGSLCLSKTK